MNPFCEGFCWSHEKSSVVIFFCATDRACTFYSGNWEATFHLSWQQYFIMILQPDLNLPRGDFYGSEIAKKSFGEVKIDSKKCWRRVIWMRIAELRSFGFGRILWEIFEVIVSSQTWVLGETRSTVWYCWISKAGVPKLGPADFSSDLP